MILYSVWCRVMDYLLLYPFHKHQKSIHSYFWRWFHFRASARTKMANGKKQSLSGLSKYMARTDKMSKTYKISNKLFQVIRNIPSDSERKQKKRFLFNKKNCPFATSVHGYKNWCLFMFWTETIIIFFIWKYFIFDVYSAENFTVEIWGNRNLDSENILCLIDV